MLQLKRSAVRSVFLHGTGVQSTAELADALRTEGRLNEQLRAKQRYPFGSETIDILSALLLEGASGGGGGAENYYAFPIIRSKQIQNRPKFPMKINLF